MVQSLQRPDAIRSVPCEHKHKKQNKHTIDIFKGEESEIEGVSNQKRASEEVGGPNFQHDSHIKINFLRILIY
jgi:hypothetical protein